MNPLAVVFIVIGSALLGLVAGACIAQHISRAITAENDELRAGLRWIRRGVDLRTVRYIDQLLGDEAA